MTVDGMVRPVLVLLAPAGALTLAGCNTTSPGTTDTQTGRTVTPAPSRNWER